MTLLATTGPQLRVALRRPAFLGLLAANTALGAIGAMSATAFDGLSPGVGLIGGAARGWAVALAAWPVLAALSTTAVLCDRGSRRVGEALLLCGQPLRTQSASHVISATFVSLLATASAVPAGALVGLGDAVRQHDGFGGALPSSPSIFSLLGSTLYLVILCLALASALRTAPRTFATLVASSLVFLTALALGGQYAYEPLRALCANSPYGPMWAFVYDGPNRSQYSLPMSALHRLLVAAAWFVIAAGTFLRTTRPARGRT